MTIGWILLDYEGNTKTPTADIITKTLLPNSVLSTPRAKLMTVDINNFYLETKLKDEQCMFLPAELTPDKITTACDLQPKNRHDNTYVSINKGIYGLKEAGALANQQLRQHLAPCGYSPEKFTPGL